MRLKRLASKYGKECSSVSSLVKPKWARNQEAGGGDPSHCLPNSGSGLDPIFCWSPCETAVSWLRWASGRHMTQIPGLEWETQVHLDYSSKSASPKSTRARAKSWGSPLQFNVDSPIKVSKEGRLIKSGETRLGLRQSWASRVKLSLWTEKGKESAEGTGLTHTS